MAPLAAVKRAGNRKNRFPSDNGRSAPEGRNASVEAPIVRPTMPLAKATLSKILLPSILNDQMKVGSDKRRAIANPQKAA